MPPAYDDSWKDKPCILVGTGNHYAMTRGRFGQTGKHRVVLEQKLGRPIKLGYLACHKCDRKNCIEPEHLFEATHKENMEDGRQKHRFPGRGNKKKGK